MEKLLLSPAEAAVHLSIGRFPVLISFLSGSATPATAQTRSASFELYFAAL
jgi:hypothetical protein